MNHETKKEETNLDVIQRINTDLLFQNVPVDELLGSVTTYSEGNDKNQALRSSARVFKKIKLDANLLNAASTSDKLVPEKKEEQRPEQIPHKEQRKLNINWVTEEITTFFFEALNEYGKDFEAIHASINQKLKKKGVSDQFPKDHVRHLYYRTWHKISKYLKISDGVKKNVQELYGLINYGELRKKVTSTQKVYYKLNELIQSGCVTVRVKGKLVRVRTPMCPALRRINKLDDKEDDLKLPQRVVVQLQPRDMQAFFKVQSFALNPRVKTILPLQKKLSTFINCISKRWKAAELEYLESNYPKEEMLMGENDEEELDLDDKLITSQLKFTPPKNAKLNLPRTVVSDFFTKDNICLRAYEERMGIDSSKFNEKKDCKKLTQRTRLDSSPETITKLPIKSEIKDDFPNQNGGDNIPSLSTTPNHIIENAACHTPMQEEFLPQNESNEAACEEFNIGFMNRDNDPHVYEKTQIVKKENESSDIFNLIDTFPTQEDKLLASSNSDDNSDNNKNNKNISVEEQLSKLAEIRNGWTIEDCDNLTIGELYLMFGSASKLVLEYHWVKRGVQSKQDDFKDETKLVEPNNSQNLNNFGFSDTLRKLVDIMKMQQKKVIPKCSCGHVCSPKNTAAKKSHIKMVEVEEKTGVDETSSETETSQNISRNEEKTRKISQFEDFVKPQCKPPPVHLIAQLDSIEKLKPKYSIRKGRRLRAKQVVVERELPLMPKASSGHQIVRMNIISQNGNNSNNQPTVEDQEVDLSAGENEHMEQVFYMEENCNQHAGEIDGNAATTEVMVAEEAHDAYATKYPEVYLDHTRSLSPSVILKENANQWISSEVADFSLSSFLGHLESPMKAHDDVSNDLDCPLRSLLTENSFDFTAKFADLANKVVGDTAN